MKQTFLEFHGSDVSVKEQVELFEGVAEEFDASDFAWATKAEDRARLWAARHNGLLRGEVTSQRLRRCH
jgi:D-lactate dehydrogenase (cytochrome)